MRTGLSLLLILTCIPTARAQESDVDKLLVPFDGTYQIERTLKYDSCGGRIVGTATGLVVDAKQGVIHADNPGRLYDARVVGDWLIAEAAFEETSCPDSTHYARWSFVLTPSGALEGMVESHWLLPPCSDVCFVRFHILATPLPP